MNKTLYIIRGCPGDGKTALAKLASLNFPASLVIAADDMPGLYENGAYQSHLQKQSHEWCKFEVGKWMKYGEPKIFVHNTFTRTFYIKPYLELAKKHGYATHIIHSEAVILPNGDRTESTHNVPEEIIKRMKTSFEAFDPLPKTGITPRNIAKQLTNLKKPNAIIFDMDKTIKQPKSENAFPQSPDDFKFTNNFKDWAKTYAHPEIKLYIASNQRGLSSEQKTNDFLEKEIELLDESLKDNFNTEFDAMYFAPESNGYNALIYEDGEWWESGSTNLIFDKPNTGIFEHICQSISGDKIWIVGDAHTSDTSTDWEFAQNCQNKFPNLDIKYVPIEMLNIFWGLVK
jgi:DNA 3'-phosphatase